MGQTEVLSGVVQSVAVAENIAYVALQGGGLSLIDISEPRMPREIGHTLITEQTRDVTVLDKIAYAATRKGLYLVDISNPATPNEISFYKLPGVNKVTVAENIAYIIDWTSLHLLDISTPYALQKISVHSFKLSIGFLSVSP